MDLRKLKTLIDLVETSGIAELEIQEGEERVRITRTVPQGQQSVTFHTSPQHAGPTAVPAAVATAAPVEAAAPAAPEGHAVKSPMVGTFYRSASPGAKAFVEIGDVGKDRFEGPGKELLSDPKVAELYLGGTARIDRTRRRP